MVLHPPHPLGVHARPSPPEFVTDPSNGGVSLWDPRRSFPPGCSTFSAPPGPTGSGCDLTPNPGEPDPVPFPLVRPSDRGGSGSVTDSGGVSGSTEVFLFPGNSGVRVGPSLESAVLDKTLEVCFSKSGLVGCVRVHVLSHDRGTRD